MVIDFYKLLNVEPKISLEDLKAEMFKQKKLKSSHASSAPSAERRREAEDFLKSLDEARKVFENESTRSAYDSKLADHRRRQEADFEQYNKKMTEMQGSAQDGADPAALMAEAQKAFAGKNYQSAVIALQKILGVAPEAIEPRKLLVKIYYAMGTELAIDAAVRELSFLEMGQSRDYEIYLYTGRIYAKLDEWSKSVKAYREAVRLNPGAPEASIELANTYLQSEYFDDAIAVYENMLDKVTDNDLVDTIKFDLSSCYVAKAMNEGTVVTEGHPFMPPDIYITEASQVTNAQKSLEAVRNLCPDHPGIADLESYINFAMQRHFVGVKAVPVIAVILGVLSLNGGPGIFFLLSAALYVFGSRQRQYFVNGRVLRGNVEGGIATWLNSVGQSGSGLGTMLFSWGIVLVLLPIIAVINTINNYVIHK